MSTVALLKNPSRFGEIDRQANDQNALLSSVRSIEQGQPLFYEGDPASHLYEVVSGTVKLYKMLPDGRRIIMGFFFPGEIIGFAITDSYSCTAEAVAPSVVRCYSRKRLEAVMMQNPAVAKHMLTAACDELSAAHNQMVVLGRKTTVERVASFLLDIADKQGVDGFNRTTINLPMFRADIADYLGLTVETVCRTLTKLKNDGVIRIERAKDIVILDHDALLDAAEGDEA